MRFDLLAGDELVGSSDLPHVDPPMGVVFGPLYPHDNYKNIQKTIQEFHLYDGSFGKIDDRRLQQVRQKIQTLDLKVKTEKGGILQPVGGVHVTDFTEKLGNEPIQLEVLRLPREQLLQYWQQAVEEYDK